MNRRSLTFRLVFLYGSLLLVLGVFFSFFTIYSFERYTRETIRTDVAARAGEVWDTVQGSIDNPIRLAALIERRFGPSAQGRFIRVSMNGAIIYRSGIPAAHDFDPKSIPISPLRLSPEILRYGDLVLYARRFATSDGHSVIVESGQSDKFAKGLEASLATSLLIGLPVLLIIAAIGGYVLMRRTLRPVESMIEAAEAITFNNPRNRLPLTGTGDRIEALGLALNRMLDRLDSAYQHANRFSTDAAHELRTPLAIIRGELEFAVAGRGLSAEVGDALGNVLEEVTRVSNMVDNLLTLSRMESVWGKRAHSNVDLYALVSETIDQMQFIAEEKDVTLQRPTGESVVVAGDKDRLKQVLVNLLDNATKYNTSGGNVTVDISSSADHARVTVTDSGIGIAPEFQTYIFDRFYRVSTDRGEIGAGLGLAIARSICNAHGGSIEVTSSLGMGSSFCIRLPLNSANNPGELEYPRGTQVAERESLQPESGLDS